MQILLSKKAITTNHYNFTHVTTLQYGMTCKSLSAFGGCIIKICTIKMFDCTSGLIIKSLDLSEPAPIDRGSLTPTVKVISNGEPYRFFLVNPI